MSTPNQNKPAIFHTYVPTPTEKVKLQNTQPQSPPQQTPGGLKPISMKMSPFQQMQTPMPPSTFPPSPINKIPVSFPPTIPTKLEPIQKEEPVQIKPTIMTPETSNRGNLPKEAVEVLRKWMFAHFDHPYPNDTDKEELMRDSGLSMTQVNNWFINARRRIWKPQKEGKTERDKGVVTAEGKIALFPNKHDEEKPSKRSRVEPDQEENVTDESDEETEDEKFARLTHENKVLKDELGTMQKSLAQMVKDFSSRNDMLMKQAETMERTIHDLQGYNDELRKQIGELTGNKEIPIQSFQKPLAVKKSDSSFFVVNPPSTQNENSMRVEENPGPNSPACK